MRTDFGIYVHTPWCRTRCPYCAFNVFLSNSADYPRWKAAILDAWSAVSPRLHGAGHSLYFGGGTPSLVPPNIIADLIESLPLQADAEITIEANPGTIDADGLSAMRTAGVNRLSLGIQTFNPTHAKALGRGHTAKQARELLDIVDTLGFDSWSMDLMFGLPNQTEAELDQDLDELSRILPPHVSIYGLSIESGTPFDKAYQAGTLRVLDGNLWRNMYDRVVHRLEAMGLHRYEVSNFAQTGHRATHNEQVWRGGYYAGLGPGAHGFLPDGSRTQGHLGLEEWYADPVSMETKPNPREAGIDYMLSSLRHIDGSSLSILKSRSGHVLSKKDIRRFAEQSLLTEHEEHVTLTHQAFPLADGILRTLINGMEHTDSLDA